jgi:hypothetical protein
LEPDSGSDVLGDVQPRIGETVKRRLDLALAAANALRGRYFVIPFAAGI